MWRSLYFYELDHRFDRGDEMKIVHSAALTAFLLLGGPALAGGDLSYKSSYCSFVSDAQELINYSSVSDLKAEVHSRYEHAAEVANSNRAIHSTTPLYEWASQAKISCAKSYGYLRMPRKWRRKPDYDVLQKCDCFYQRMTAYLGH
jgi:hypothetical protein